MKPWQRLLVAVAVFVTVIVVLYRPVKPAPAPPPAKPLVRLDSGAVTGVTVEQPNLPAVRLSKAEGQWRLTQPYAYPADSASVTSLVSGLGNITDAQDLGSGASAKLGAFGLDHPATVRLTLNGGKTMQFDFGAESPTGGNTYMRVGGGGAIEMVPDYVKQDALQTAFGLQDKAILHFPEAEVTGLTATANGKTVHYAKSNDAWPQDQSAAIQNLLDAVEDAQMTAMPDAAGKDAAADGLTHPAMTLALTWKGGSGTLQIGAKKGAAEYYARNSSSPAIFTLSDYLIADVNGVVTPAKPPAVSGGGQ